MKSVLVCIGGLAILAGCTSGGAGFERRAATALLQYNEVIALDATPVMPETRTNASFNGYISFDFPVLILGDVQLTANFDADSLDGTFGNLVDGDDESVEGDGTIAGTFTGNSISAELNGSGSSGGEDFTVTDQGFSGEFRGEGATAIFASDEIEVVGSVSGPDDVSITIVATR